MSKNVDDRSANKRGSARFSAVQALYQMDIVGTGLSEVSAEYENFRLGKEVDGFLYREADIQWFRAILSGVIQYQKEIDRLINQSLNNDWSLSRLDSVLRAILRASTFELIKRKDVPFPVIMSEYIDIAQAFYENGESAIVNGVLSRIVCEIRGSDSDTLNIKKSNDERIEKE